MVAFSAFSAPPLSLLYPAQSNPELTARALPEISAHLSHQDQTVVAEAAKLMHELSKKEGSLQAVIANPSVVRQSIQTLTTVTNAEIQKPLSGMLHNISNDRCLGWVLILPPFYPCVCVLLGKV